MVGRWPGGSCNLTRTSGCPGTLVKPRASGARGAGPAGCGAAAVADSLRLGLARGLAGSRRFGQPGVQPFPDFIRGSRTAAPLVADDHHPGRGYAREGGQSQHLVPAHLLRLDRVRREYQPG